MAREIRTPLNYSPAVELGNGIWWKQALPANKRIKYGDRYIDFNEHYCRNAEAAFKRRAFDTVPFVLAPKDNSHTMAAQAGQYGEILAAKVDMDAKHPETGEPAPGLYYAVKLDDEANQIVEKNPRFGVSIRAKEDYDRADGEHFDVAVQHLLGTWDPVLNGLAPWAPFDGQVDLSNPPGTAVIDLSGLTFESAEKEGADMAPQTETDPSTLFAAFQRWYDAGQPDPGEQPDDGEDETGEDTEGEDTGGEGDDQADELDIDSMTDDEFDAFAQELLADDEPAVEPEPEVVAASQPGDPDSLELSNTDPRVIEMSQQMTEMRSQLDASNYERERDQIVRRTGIPPHIVDLARPLLEGSGRTVDLANGSTADAGQVVRGLIDEFGKTARLLDLSESLGQLNVTDEDTEATEKRQALAQSVIGRAGL